MKSKKSKDVDPNRPPPPPIGTTLSMQTRPAGTTTFLPPEYMISGRTTVHPSADVYSLAVLLFIMFNDGWHPWYSLDSELYENKIAQGYRPPLSTHKFPDGVRRLLRDMWKTDPRERPTMQVVIRRLKALARAQLKRSSEDGSMSGMSDDSSPRTGPKRRKTEERDNSAGSASSSSSVDSFNVASSF